VAERAPSSESRPAGRRPPARRARARAALAKLATPHDPLTSLVLTVPVFLAYHLGIVFMDLRNGADLVSGLFVALVHASLPLYVGLTLGVAVALGVAVYFLRGKNVLRLSSIGPVIAESTAWAAGMWLLCGWATARLVGAVVVPSGAMTAFDLQIGGRTLGIVERVVMAAGAGFHEEFVFRVVVFGGLSWLLSSRGVPRVRADLASALVSSLVFSAVHYIGPLGDAFQLGSFVFRALSGLYLALVYRLRGFAVAVYTHALYDLAVFFLVL
jgi:hypothetical protein